MVKFVLQKDHSGQPVETERVEEAMGQAVLGQ